MVDDSMALVVAEPVLITLSGGGWEGMRAWAYPRPKTSMQNVPSSAPVPQQGAGLFSLVNSRSGYVAKANAGTYRAWSEASPWVRACIDILRDAVSSAEWDILPIDKEGPKHVGTARRLRRLLEEPNPGESFWGFIQRIVEDVCVLDAGCIEKVRYPNGDLAELYPVMGETIWVNARWDGSNPDEPRYIWAPDGTVRDKFTDDDFIYIMQNPRTNSSVGLSPLEVLKRTIEAELNSMDYNSRMVRGAPPEGALNIGETAMKEDVLRTKAEWESDILGQSGFAIIGGYKAPSFIKFRDTNQEMQYREWLDYLVRQHAVVFGLSPMDLGITFDVNRSTAEQQADTSEARGPKPLMASLQSYLTRHIIHDDSFGGRENNLQFVFTALNLKESQARANINKIAVGSTPWKTVNEARLMEGRAPLGDLNDDTNVFNHIIAMTPKGMMDVTEGKYVGEEDLAQIAADANIDVAEAQGEIDQANADKQAQNQVKIEAAKPKPTAPTGGGTK